jgi:allene oxide cyclase-like protein
MRRPAAVLGTGIVAISSFVVGSPSAMGDLGASEFRLKAITVHEQYNDIGKKNESLGDTFTFTEKLFHGGERVGRDAVTCTIIAARPSAFRLLCWGTLTLFGRGDLTVHGKVLFREGATALPELAVTGGTGDYAGASGTMTIDEGTGQASRYLITLLP